MLAISRFDSPTPQFLEQLRSAIDWWRDRPGCEGIDLLQNLDEPTLWAVVSRWENVGAYRRSFNGYDAKMILTPVLAYAVNEPHAYLPPEELS
ncbi:MAG TPA: antibiotic biosynthesis monooxygenase [Tessaracoccus flavescens]|uniref:Antibiotic biosynthesis monooxygenase n=1 Tax=Tessaracoccus flavescens TaxID=399497 RepID=A0A921EQG5_9ACTN|nr:antibiotic biosynthesis monooxygenase [Tessaracoccus flavescens]